MTGESARSVIAVDPEHLRQALLPVFAWLNASGDAEDGSTIPALNLLSLVERFQQAFLLDKLTTVALFIRAVALSRFCTDNDVPSFLCKDGLPGLELCAAAAWLPVIETVGQDDQEICHSFDAVSM